MFVFYKTIEFGEITANVIFLSSICKMSKKSITFKKYGTVLMYLKLREWSQKLWKQHPVLVDKTGVSGDRQGPADL